MSMINNSNNSSVIDSGSVSAVLSAIFRTEGGKQRLMLRSQDGRDFTLMSEAGWDCVPVLCLPSGVVELPVREQNFKAASGEVKPMLIPEAVYVLDGLTYVERTYVHNGTSRIVREVVGGTWREILSSTLTVASTKKR